MSVDEISRSIARLTPEQQAIVARFVTKVRRSNTPARRRQLADTGREMEAGKSHSQAEVDAALARRLTRR